MFDINVMHLIAQEIYDSKTWINFSETCKKINKYCKQWLVRKEDVIMNVTIDTIDMFELNTILHYKNNICTQLPSGALHGKITEYYDPEKLIIGATHYWKTSVFHGEYLCWDKKGQLIKKFNRVDGKSNCNKSTWYSNGQLKYEDNLQNGKRHGFYREWYSNGLLKCERNYQNGKLHGLSRRWHSNGQLLSKEIHLCEKTNRTRTRFVWYCDGQIKSKTTWYEKKTATILSPIQSIPFSTDLS